MPTAPTTPSCIPEWLEERSAGLLLHLSCLPGDYGIGNLGEASQDLIDFLDGAGFRFWQIWEGPHAKVGTRRPPSWDEPVDPLNLPAD